MKIILIILFLLTAGINAFANCVDLSGTYRIEGKDINCRGDLKQFSTPFDDRGVLVAVHSDGKCAIIFSDQIFKIIQIGCEDVFIVSSEGAYPAWFDAKQLAFSIDLENRSANFSTKKISTKVVTESESFIGTPQKWTYTKSMSLKNDGSLVFKSKRKVTDFGFLSRTDSYTCVFESLE